MKKTLTLNCVIPIYNEEKNLIEYLTKIISDLNSLLINYEIILVNNGSTDKTPKIIQDLAQQYHFIRQIQLPQPNYGGALRIGILAAEGAIVYTCDIEFSDKKFLAQGISLLNKSKNCLIINGSKVHPDKIDNRDYWRKFLTIANYRLIRILFNSKFTDPNGLKILKNTPALKKIASQCSPFNHLFETEFCLTCQKQGYQIIELPVTIEERRQGKISTFLRIPRVISEIILLRKKLG